MKERYGWDKYKKEGLAEMERVKSFMVLPKDEAIIDLVERYIRLYKDKKIYKKDDISAVILYQTIVEETAQKRAKKYLEAKVTESRDKDLLHLLEKESVNKATKVFLKSAKTDKKLREELEKPAQDKASNQAKKLRSFLEDFYNSAEGKKSEYRLFFVSDERDYRLGIKKADILGKTNKETGTKLPEFAHIKEILLSFFKIYPEAWAMPKRLVARSTASKTFNWDTIAIFLLSATLVVLMSRSFFSSYKFYVETANIHPVLTNFLLARLGKIERPFDNILSFELLFYIFRFAVITTIIPWLIYTKIFKGSASVYEIMNLQFYFLSSWIPVFVWVGFADIKLTFLNADATLLRLFTALLGLWVLYTYYKCLYQLSGFTWKKGISPYIIYIPVHLWFITIL